MSTYSRERERRSGKSTSRSSQLRRPGIGWFAIDRSPLPGGHLLSIFISAIRISFRLYDFSLLIKSICITKFSCRFLLHSLDAADVESIMLPETDTSSNTIDQWTQSFYKICRLVQISVENVEISSSFECAIAIAIHPIVSIK